MAFINMDIKKQLLEDLSEVKKNLLLLLSANSCKPINGKLWYQKELFLLAKNNKKLEEGADFEAYFLGPYSELAEAEMEELVQLGVVRNVGSTYILTDIGKEIAHSVLKETSKSELVLVEDVKNFFSTLSKDQLLLFIYLSYPEMAEDSIEFKELLPRRKEIAISMYRQGKISVGKAAELAGVSVSEMIEELNKRKIYKIDEA